MYSLGIDIGGTKCAVILGKGELTKNTEGFIIDKIKFPTNVSRGYEKIIAEIIEKGDEILSENFGIPYDDNDELLLSQKEAFEALGISVGKHIQGNLGQTLIPNAILPSGKMSTNNSIQIIINSNGSLNHRTVGISHEFAHVILFLRNLPFSHTQPGVDFFIDKRTTTMSKRLGYEY